MVFSEHIRKLSFQDPNIVYDRLRELLVDFKNFCASLWGRWAVMEGAIKDKRNNELKLENVIDSALNSISFSWDVLSQPWETNVDGGSYLQADNIKIRTYVHDPEQVKLPLGASWKIDHLRIKFEDSRKEQKSMRLPVIKCSKVQVTFQVDLELVVKKSYKIKKWAKVFSLGINSAFDQTKTFTDSVDGIRIEATTQHDGFRVRNKPNIVVSVSKAEEFLQYDQHLQQMKEKIGSNNDKTLKCLRHKEIESMAKNQPLECTDSNDFGLSEEDFENFSDDDEEKFNFKNVLQEAHNDEMDIHQAEKDETLRDSFARKAVGIIQSNATATRNACEIQSQRVEAYPKALGMKATKDTASNLIQTQGKFIREYDTFSQIPNEKGQRNGVGGVIFENLVDARVKTNMKIEGKPVDSVPGDGKGIIPEIDNQTNLKTPEYSDLVYIDSKTKEFIKMVQCKFSDNPEALEQGIKNHYEEWSKRKLPKDLSDKLHPVNIDVVSAPDAVMDEKITVPINKKGDKAQIKVKSTVDIDGVKTKAPKIKEVGKYYDKNIKVLQELQELHKDYVSSKNALAGLKKTLEKFETKGVDAIPLRDKKGKNEETLKNEVKKIIEGKKKQIKMAENAIEEYDKISEGLKDMDEAKTRKLAKRHLIKGMKLQMAIGAVVTGTITFVTSLKENIQKYQNGQMTGWEMVKDVSLATTKATISGGASAGALVVAQYGLQTMAASKNMLISCLGSGVGKALCPALLGIGIGVQTYSILKSYNKGQIGTGEMQRHMARMVTQTGLSVGKSIYKKVEFI